MKKIEYQLSGTCYQNLRCFAQKYNKIDLNSEQRIS